MTKNKKIDLVILVGGSGSRIKKLLKNKPKPLASFENYCFLDLIIRNCTKYNFSKIYLLAGFKGNLIKNKYHKKKINFIPIECLVEKKPLGTGGALRLLKNKVNNEFILLNGDTYNEVNLNNIIKKKIKNNQGCLYLVKNKYYKSNKKLTSIDIDNKGKVLFKKSSNYINGGIYKFHKNIINLIKIKNTSLETEILPNLIIQKKIFGFISDDFFIDIGTKKNFIFAKKKLISFIKKPALFLDRDGTINKDLGYTHKIKDLRFKRQITKGLKYISKKNYYIFIITNQSGIGRGFFKIEDLEKFQLEIKKRFLKKDIFINGVEYCPYHPEAKIKKYRKLTSLRKPGNKMIKNIFKYWPIEINKSAMIGDKISDQECAKKSNLKFFYTNNNFLKICKKLSS